MKLPHILISLLITFNVCLADVTVFFTHPSGDSIRYDVYWGEYSGSRAFYRATQTTKLVIESRWFIEGVEYFFFVVAIDSLIMSAPSEIVSIVYGQATGVEISVVRTEQSLTYPNPFNSILTIREGEVNIYNISGKHIGKFSRMWDASRHASGLYLIRDKFNNVEIVTLIK